MEQDIAFGVITWRLMFIAVAILLLAGEAMIGGFFLVWFAAALFITGIAAHFIDMTLMQGFLSMAVLTVINLGIWWKFFRRQQDDTEEEFNNLNHQLVGKQGVAIADFVAGNGKVKVTDTLYSATGDDVKEGPVIVEAVDESLLTVRNLT